MNWIKDRIKSFGFAFKGLFYGCRTQTHLKMHLVAAALAIAAGFILNIDRIEWILVLIMTGLVISAELFNTSIEKLVDLVSPEQNKTAGHVKDLAAAAVLVTAFIALLTGCLIFIPRLLSLL